jgi:hypothetical protein
VALGNGPVTVKAKITADELAILELISNVGVVSDFAQDPRVVRLLSLKFVTVDGDYVVATSRGEAFLLDARPSQ